MASILKHVSALAASRQLGIRGIGLQQVIEGLSPAKASDQAPGGFGMGLRERLAADIRIASQGRRNAHDAASHLQVAHVVLSEVRNLLVHAAELSLEAQSYGLNEPERARLELGFQDTLRVISEIGCHTKLNGINVFGSSIRLVAGAFGTLEIHVPSINSDASTPLGLRVGSMGLGSPAGAALAAAAIATALEGVMATRASLSASMERLGAVATGLGIQAESLASAYGQLRGAQALGEVVSLIQWQLLNWSGSGRLAQVNRVNELLALLQAGGL